MPEPDSARLFDLPALEAASVSRAASFSGMGAAAEMLLAAALLERGHKVARADLR